MCSGIQKNKIWFTLDTEGVPTLLIYFPLKERKGVFIEFIYSRPYDNVYIYLKDISYIVFYVALHFFSYNAYFYEGNLGV